MEPNELRSGKIIHFRARDFGTLLIDEDDQERTDKRQVTRCTRKPVKCDMKEECSGSAKQNQKQEVDWPVRVTALVNRMQRHVDNNLLCDG